MPVVKRFCCKFSIASGVQVIGYANISQAIGIIALYAVLEMYEYITLAILPILCLYAFIKMMKKDGIKPRFRFYFLQTLKAVMFDCVLVSNLALAKYMVDHDEDFVGHERAKVFGETPGFEIAVVLIALQAIMQFYFALILRQHYKNRKEGMGDARKSRSGQLPQYLMAQKDWVQELH